MIDKQLLYDALAKKNSKPVEVVILGPSDSGKSTFLRQVTLFYGETYDADELRAYKAGINQTIRRNFNILYTVLKSSGRLQKFIPTIEDNLVTKILIQAALHLLSTQEKSFENLSISEAETVAKLWKSPQVKTFCSEYSSSIGLDDTAA